MEPRLALHTAARRFCADRFSEWTNSYSQLNERESCRAEDRFSPSWTYSDEAFRIFPRYRLDSNIQAEIEKLTPDSVSTLEELRSRLIKAAELAELQLLKEFSEKIARQAIAEETDDYKAYIRTLAEGDLFEVLPLPYRRVLTDEESTKLWDDLTHKWNLDESYWFPLKQGPLPDNVLAFHVDYFSRNAGSELLRSELSNRGIKRVFQLHEFKSIEPEYEIEVASLAPSYANGGEQYCVSESVDWVVYASHESSITIAGDWLVDAFKSAWPDWQGREYGGPFSTSDLRGTWETK